MAKTLSERIADMEALGTPDLRTRWKEAFGRPAPKRASRDLLLRALAYCVQEQADGGLGKAAKRRLAALAKPDANEKRTRKPPAPRLKPGTRLVREWRGEVHQVTVADDGFDYRGTRYGSLCEIARAIAGTRWSGPLFFGLRKSGGSKEQTDGR